MSAFLALAGLLFFKVIVPILLTVGLGAGVQKFHPLDTTTLARLQVWALLPAFLFVRVAESTLSGRQLFAVAGTTLLVQAVLGLAVFFYGKRRKTSPPTLSAVLLAATVFNAGNFGIPVAERAFGKAGGAVQACIVLAANLSVWGVGYALSAAIRGGGDSSRPAMRDALKSYARLPMLWATLAALLARAAGGKLPEPAVFPLHGLADALVPLAQMTLGAQLMKQTRLPRWRVVLPVAFLKLLVLPAIAAVVVRALGLWPWPGAVIVVAAAGPTAVNVLLLAIEQDGDVELAAECVFWTTLLSAITVTAVLTMVISLGGVAPH